MARIFISYRREDTAGHSGRLYDRLSGHFGRDNVFIDVDTIEPGLDFVEVIEEAVGKCDALLAVIGGRWLDEEEGTGSPRLNNPEDFVRLEIQTALGRDIRIIPVLVDGATMPRSTDLPDRLQPLARRQALELTTQFHPDVDRLIESLESVLDNQHRDEAPPQPKASEEDDPAPNDRDDPAARVEAPARPRPGSLPAALVVLSDFKDTLPIHLYPQIDSKVESNVRENSLIEEGETLFGTVDLTIFGSSKNHLSITERGVHFRNSRFDEPGFFTWSEFCRVEVARVEGTRSVAIGDSQVSPGPTSADLFSEFCSVLHHSV